MRTLLVLAAALVAVQSAQAATPKTGFAFGRAGGNIRPYTVTIAASGAVSASGAVTIGRKRLTSVQLASLDRLAVTVHFATLPAATSCPGTLPDVAAQLIRVGSRTVRVHGACVAGFDRLWSALVKATAAA